MAARFFLPLMLTAELMMISHAIISAFLARMDDPETVLAAYSISFYLHAALGSPVWACQVVAVSYIRDRASFLRMVSFGAWVGTPVIVLWAFIGTTPLGDWVYGGLFGAGPEVVRAAKHCTLIFIGMIVFIVLRSAIYALFMVKQRTIFITYGSILRLISLALLLYLLSGLAQGAEVGAAALVACVVIETIAVYLMARPYLRALPEGDSPPSYRDLIKLSWPIMVMHLAESGVVFCLNIFLGRLLRPELALAAFGILDSVLRVLLSPTRNLIPVVQTLVNSPRDLPAVLLFSLIVGLSFAGIMLLFLFEPVQVLVLIGIMGVPSEMADYIAPALILGALLAITMTISALTRGLLINAKRTNLIAVSSVGRLLVVVLVGGGAILIDAQNGAMIGILALIAGFAFEGLLLAGRLLKMRGSARWF